MKCKTLNCCLEDGHRGDHRIFKPFDIKTNRFDIIKRQQQMAKEDQAIFDAWDKLVEEGNQNDN